MRLPEALTALLYTMFRQSKPEEAERRLTEPPASVPVACGVVFLGKLLPEGKHQAPLGMASLLQLLGAATGEQPLAY